MSRPRASLAVATLTAALLCAPSAPAAPPPLGLPPLPGSPSPPAATAPLLRAIGSPLSQADFAGRALELRFRNRDGYEIAVAGSGQTVLLAVSRPGLLSSATTVYLAHGKVGAGSIGARFADLGRIAMRFRPSGRVLRRGGFGCPRRVVARFGVFVGELSFSGEGGYTSVHVHRAKGTLFTPPGREVCGHRGLQQRRSGGSAAHRCAVGPRGGEKATALMADWKQPLARTAFAALTPGLGLGLTFFIGIDETSEGSIAVVREALALSRSSTFAVDDTLASASVSPPPPFSGSGSFQHEADGTASWTGSLAVSFPGAPDVPLTGPQFKTELEREW